MATLEIIPRIELLNITLSEIYEKCEMFMC